MLRKPRNIVLILCLTLISSAGCTDQKTRTGSDAIRGDVDFKQVLSWLPADTETLLVANRPFWMSNFQIGEEGDKNRKVTTEELEKHFESLTLGLFNFKDGLLEKHLEGKKVLFAAEGSRHFRPPAGLGELPFEGCALAVFKDDLGDSRDAFMKGAAHTALRMEEIEGQRVAVFDEPSEQDIWTIFITFPQKGVVLVATNESFLQEMLARMRRAQGERALPDTLPEWRYVNKQAEFWGLRHFDKRQAKEDPTSPFGGKKSANFPDEKAIGLTYQYNAGTERRATVTYIADPSAETRKITEDRFPGTGDSERMAGLHIQYQELASGVIQSTVDLSHSQPTDLFFFIFMAHLGHAVYV